MEAYSASARRGAKPPCRDRGEPPPMDGDSPPPLGRTAWIRGADSGSGLAGVFVTAGALAAFLVVVSVWPKILVMALLRGFPAAVPMVAPEAAAACSARLCAWTAVTNKKLPSKAIGASERMDFSL